MPDEIGGHISVTPRPGSLGALEELVEELIRVDAAGSTEPDTIALDGTYRASLQKLVTNEMMRHDAAPDFRKLLTAALETWAATE